jgi:centromeric protein E
METEEPENIAVCIRVRPLNERELRAQDAPALSLVPGLNAVALTDPATGAPLAGKGNVFQYDGIFDERADSRAIYARVARRIVRSTLSGINGTIFAYGQTSSGKTFTMQGDDGALPFQSDGQHSDSSQSDSPPAPGILQLAVEDIFRYIESCADRDFLLRVSFLEIYNEVVRDLLRPSDTSLKLREDPRKGVYVECTEEIITNCDDIVKLLQRGNANRTVGHTAMNDKSSRSHSVFRIVVESKQKSDSRRLSEEDVNGAVLVASLNLVDLAGSESLRHTGAEGIRQREAGNINKSLLTLARVINSLASSGGRAQNAPFRDSKLTRLLQNSLGGNTRTLIVCCVTPSDRYIEETKSTLQFAARAKDIQTTATVNEVLDDQTQLRRLKREVHELKKLVNSEALDALKAENEALLSEKSHKETEMARLKGLILTSTSVTRATAGHRRGKRMRETWGPGDFPVGLKALAPPSKRHSSAKENVDPQTPGRADEDAAADAAKEADNPAFDPARKQLQATRPGVGPKESSKKVLDLFSAVFRSYRDGKYEDPLAGLEAVVNEKSASLADIERARAFDVVAEIRHLMVANTEARTAVDEKLVLEQEVAELRAKLTEAGSDARVGELSAELACAQEVLAQERKRGQDLGIEKANSQDMAAEELESLRCHLETLKLESSAARERFDSDRRQLEASLEAMRSGRLQAADEEKSSLRSRIDELESLLKDMKASQTVLQRAVAARDEEIASLEAQEAGSNPTEAEACLQAVREESGALEKISELDEEAQHEAPTIGDAAGPKRTNETDVPSTIHASNAVVEKLAREMQDVLQELAQLQADHERTELEKEELQTQSEQLGEELELARRQGYGMSEALMEKEHVAKVLQAQLDAKVMTISQMQTKHSADVEELQKAVETLTAQKARVQEVSTAESPASADVKMQGPNLRSDVEQLTEKLAAVESELADTQERLQASLASSGEQTELQNAFDRLQADFDALQSTKASAASPEEQHQREQARPSDDQSASSPAVCLQERFDALRDDFKRVVGELESASRERDDCVDELRALESQLMEASEERMKLSMAADEQETQLREVQQVATSASERMASLQAQLEEAQAEKATLEASKAELAQSVEQVQDALAALQADHAALVEQLQQRKTPLEPESEDGVAAGEQLQQRLESESRQRAKLELDVQSYEGTLSALRTEAKASAETIAGLTEKMNALEADLAAASRTQGAKQKELSKLADALSRAREEQHEMRLQSKQRLVAAEGKEMALEEKVSALEQQLRASSAGATPIQPDTQQELMESKAKLAALENELATARGELSKQDAAWSQKQAMAEREFARLSTERTELRAQLSSLHEEAGASQHGTETHAEELQKARQSCAELSQQKEALQRELDAVNAAWGEKQRGLMQQMERLRGQFQAAQEELEACQKSADDEIHRLRAVVEQREAELESHISEQEAGQSRQEALQAKCDELDDERRQLKDECAALEAQRGRVEEQLQREISELAEKFTAAHAQQATYQRRLKEMETQLELTENEVVQSRSEMKTLAEALKASQVEAVQYHNQLVEAQLAKEGVDRLVERQKARIDKLDKVKMTTETLELFRKLKRDRHELQVKVQALEKDVEHALTQTQEGRREREQRLVERKDEELKLLQERVEELREALQGEKRRAADVKAELADEREKAEHEIQEMQTLVKEKLELVETLESQAAALEDAMASLREQKSDKVAYLEKENLELHVENRELKTRVEAAPSRTEQDALAGDTGTFDASAAAAAKVLGEESANEAEADVIEDHSQPEDAKAKAGGFLLSKCDLDAIAAASQEEPQDGGQPQCTQQ